MLRWRAQKLKEGWRLLRSAAAYTDVLIFMADNWHLTKGSNDIPYTLLEIHSPLLWNSEAQ